MHIYPFIRIVIHPMSKLARQNLILELVQREPLASQDELRHRLRKRGCKVAQATLSRDIHELRLVKTQEGYAVPGEQAAEPALPPLIRLVREFVAEVREAQNLLVLRTSVGSAQPVAAAVDAAAWPEIVGTVAGDDTILIVSQDKKKAHRLALRIGEMLA